MKKQPHPSVQTFAPGAFRKATPLFSLLFMLLFTGAAFSQESVSLNSIQKDADTTVWHPLKTIGAVTVSYQYVSCGPAAFVHFRISNASGNKVAVSWTYKQYKNGNERNLIEDLANVNYTVEANTAIQGVCGGSDNYFKLAVMVGEEGLEKRLTDIALTAIAVNNAQ